MEKSFKVYGIGALDPVVVMHTLEGMNKAFKKPCRVQVGKQSRPKGIVFFHNSEDAISFSFKYFKLAKRDFIPVAFDVAKFMEKKGIVVLDKNDDTAKAICKRLIHECRKHTNRKRKTIDARFVAPIKFVRAEIDKAKKKISFVQIYLNMFYKVSGQELKALFKESLMAWLYSKLSDEGYVKKLSTQRPKKKSAIEKFDMLVNLIKTPVAANMRNAISETRKGVDVKEAADKAKVAAYDIRYVLSQAKDKGKDNDSQRERTK